MTFDINNYTNIIIYAQFFYKNISLRVQIKISALKI